MSEILSRAKRKDNQQWVYGFYAYSKKSHKTYIIVPAPPKDNATFIFEEVIPETVGRYIGIPDKTNQKIFDGDIIKTKYGRICKVIWFSTESCQCWDMIPLESKHPVPDKYDLWNSQNLEVIGNIYDDTNKIGVT